MEISWSVLLWSGVIATTFAAATFWAFHNLGWTRFTPGTMLAALMFRDVRAPLAETVGQVVFFVLGSVVLPWGYGYLFALVGGPGTWTGGALGALHGLVVALIMPVFGTISASVRHGRESPPGWLGLGWGKATPFSLLVGHLVYGGVLGASLAAFGSASAV